MVKRVLLVLAALVVAGGAYLLLWPVPFDPAPWTPPPAPRLEGPYAPNDRLAAAEWIARGLAPGPEAVALDDRGRACTGTKDGRVLRVGADGRVEVLADTGGRPLGLAFAPDGRALYVADHLRGLLRLAPPEPGGRLEVLATEAEGVPFGFTDDVDVGPDGTVYFSDASSLRREGFRIEFLEHQPRGRLLAWHPGSGRVEVLVRGLHFANGVAVGPDGAFVAVSETAEYRVLRHWLRGPRKGETDVLADNLPGFPDNVTWSKERRVFWVALFSPRLPTLDAILPRPWLRKVTWRLPEAVQPRPPRHAFVVALAPDGRPLESLQHVGDDAYAPITSARERDGWLWLGSLEREGLARVPLR